MMGQFLSMIFKFLKKKYTSICKNINIYWNFFLFFYNNWAYHFCLIFFYNLGLCYINIKYFFLNNFYFYSDAFDDFLSDLEEKPTLTKIAILLEPIIFFFVFSSLLTAYYFPKNGVSMLTLLFNVYTPLILF